MAGCYNYSYLSKRFSDCGTQSVTCRKFNQKYSYKLVMRNIFKYIVLGLVVAGAATVSAETRSPKKEIARNLDIFNSIYKTLQTTYVDSIDAEKSITTAIKAMLNDIDPYTEYFAENDQDDFLTISTGEYGGIGSYIMERDNGNVYISEPNEGMPAHLAGLRAGDLIVTIDNDTVLGLGREKVSSRLKGQAGTHVKVMVNRPYVEDSILTFDIVRSKIDINPVPYYGVVNGDVGYIELTTFNEKSADRVREAFIELKKDPRVKSLILDLRGNGGGLLESAVKIVGLFVPKGTEVLRTRGRGMLNEKIYKTTNAPVDTEMPLAVLINGASASSSEIVTGALQDLDRAVIVGNRSFGKGLVQSTSQLPYNGMLKVTIAKYYIPSGRLIQAIDYSHRNPDGSVARIPDSLTTVFHTRAGREVRDGGGITPDIKVDYPDVSRLTYNVVANNWIFDYATRFAASHQSIPQPEEFEITDEIYDDFKSTIDPDKLEYDKLCEIIIDELEKAAKTEGYMNDSVQAQIDALKVSLHHNLDRDLDINRKEISKYLATEILQRYYFTPGAIRKSLLTDIDIEAAVKILQNPEEYRKLLSGK